MKKLFLVFLFTSAPIFLFASNYIRMVPDSTNSYAMFEMSRTNTASYKITFANDKGVILYETVETIGSEPKIISIPWRDFSPGIYYLVAKNKRETVKLLFMKKE